MRFAVISGLLGIASSLLLVSTYGGTGVAIGVSVGLVLHNMSMWHYCYKKLGVKTHMRLKGLGDSLTLIKNEYKLKKK